MRGIGTIDWRYRWNAPSLAFTQRDGQRSSSVWLGRIAGVDRHGRAPERAWRAIHVPPSEPGSLSHARVGAARWRAGATPAGGQELNRARLRPHQGATADRLGGLLAPS